MQDDVLGDGRHPDAAAVRDEPADDDRELVGRDLLARRVDGGGEREDVWSAAEKEVEAKGDEENAALAPPPLLLPPLLLPPLLLPPPLLRAAAEAMAAALAPGATTARSTSTPIGPMPACAPKGTGTVG